MKPSLRPRVRNVSICFQHIVSPSSAELVLQNSPKVSPVTQLTNRFEPKMQLRTQQFDLCTNSKRWRPILGQQGLSPEAKRMHLHIPPTFDVGLWGGARRHGLATPIFPAHLLLVTRASSATRTAEAVAVVQEWLLVGCEAQQ